MLNIRALLPTGVVSLQVLLGSFAGACWSYTSEAGMGGAGGNGNGSGGSGGNVSYCNAPTAQNVTLPCDVLEGAGLSCVSAHSTVRVVVRDYCGPLYQLKRSDEATMEIGSIDGYADAAAHDAFCSTGDCVFEIIYDQAPFGNHLTIAPPGQAKNSWARPAPAHRLPVKINGRSVYGIRFNPGEGYRANCYACPYPKGPAGTAVDDEPQTIYMVSSQKNLINGCCFDYGNAETSANNDGNGTMEAVYLGNGVIWGSGVEGGPWVMADLENGLFPGWEDGMFDDISTNTPVLYDFVSAMIVGDTQDKNGGKGRFAVYGGDATAGAVKQMYDGIRPETPGYIPMKKQGSVILSIGGDNSDGDGGLFYEGVMANGAASPDTINALQNAIVAANYGK
jgi:non-reducing end alpha-L-arabinofuranosidase